LVQVPILALRVRPAVSGEGTPTFLDYPPMQRGASFNLDAVKAEMAKRMEQAQAASKGPGQ
jgi:arylsulfatase